MKDAGKAVRNVKDNNVRHWHVLKYVVSFFGCSMLCKLISDMQSGYMNSGSTSWLLALSILCQYSKRRPSSDLENKSYPTNYLSMLFEIFSSNFYYPFQTPDFQVKTLAKPSSWLKLEMTTWPDSFKVL